MKLEFMEIPRYVMMGAKALTEVSTVYQRLGLARVVHIVCGATSTCKVAEEVVSTLNGDGFKASKTVVDASMITEVDVKTVHENARLNGAQSIIGVGGGRVIDVAKLAASWLGIHFISVPTSAAHDGISSPFVNFLLRHFVKERMGEEYVRPQAPVAIIADTDVIRKAPHDMLAAGCGDLIAKLTSVRDWQLASRLKGEEYHEYAASMALMGARLVKSYADSIHKGSEEGTRVVVKALIGSGVSMSIAGSSRPASGAEHLFSHALDLLSLKYGFKPARHGEQCGVGAIIMTRLQGANWEKVRDVLERVGAPTSAEGLRLEPKHIVEALTHAKEIRPDRYTILSENRLSDEAAESLAVETRVI